MERFEDWLTFHRQQFPNIGIWLSGLDAVEVQIESWREVLSDCLYEDCIEATKRIKAGDFDKPFANEDTPATIRSVSKVMRSERKLLAKMSQPTYTSGQRTYDCPLCWDQGTVTVVHLDSYEAARRDGPDAILESMSLPCNCFHGQPHRESMVVVGKKKTETPYHPHTFRDDWFFPMSKIELTILSPVDWSLPTKKLLEMANSGEIEVEMDIMPFIEWLQTFDALKLQTQPGYVSEFSEF